MDAAPAVQACGAYSAHLVPHPGSDARASARLPDDSVARILGPQKDASAINAHAPCPWGLEAWQGAGGRRPIELSVSASWKIVLETLGKPGLIPAADKRVSWIPGTRPLRWHQWLEPVAT